MCQCCQYIPCSAIAVAAGAVPLLLLLLLPPNRYGKDLRVAEMNTISNSGREGLSDNLAAALWTLDGAFEVANTGAVGINLHWGSGLTLYAALLRQQSGAAYVKPPYYAYLLFQMALGQGARLVQLDLKAKPQAKLKVWALQDYNSGSLRVVLINKHATAGAGVAVQLPAGYHDGKLIRLMGKRGLEDEWGISLGNMTYNLGGQAFGVPAGEVIFAEALGVSPGTTQGTPNAPLGTPMGTSEAVTQEAGRAQLNAFAKQQKTTSAPVVQPARQWQAARLPAQQAQQQQQQKQQVASVQAKRPIKQGQGAGTQNQQPVHQQVGNPTEKQDQVATSPGKQHQQQAAVQAGDLLTKRSGNQGQAGTSRARGLKQAQDTKPATNGLKYTVYMPAGSAALLIIPKQ